MSSESLRLLGTLLAGTVHDFDARAEVPGARIFIGDKSISFPVIPPARSIPRYELDSALLDSARRCGVHVEEGISVRDVTHNGSFAVRTAETVFTSAAVVNSTGRWSQLTQYAAADREKWIGLKAHFLETAAPRSVDLYFFPGGYCGVTPVDDNTVNACAMVQADTARTLEEVFTSHPALLARSRKWQALFPPVTTSPLYFRKPQTSAQEMLLAGDSAGFIDPFAGDGISLALHSGALAAEHLLPFLQGKRSLEECQRTYRDEYFRRFAPAFRNAALMRSLLRWPKWLRPMVIALLGTRPIAHMMVRGTRAQVR